jgi:hypothetical protein
MTVTQDTLVTKITGNCPQAKVLIGDMMTTSKYDGEYTGSTVAE